MNIKSARIFIKYLRKFLAGFVSTIPFVHANSNSYPFASEHKALDKDWVEVGEDLNLAINKTNKNNERKQP